MPKVVINTCYGGFGLSKDGLKLYCQQLGLDPENTDDYNIPRNDPVLVELVENFEVDGECANLKVVEVPDGVEWHIQEYDGHEWVAENHRTWR